MKLLVLGLIVSVILDILYNKFNKVSIKEGNTNQNEILCEFTMLVIHHKNQ